MPPLVEAPVLEVERVCQSVKVQRRLKALSHLPLTATFSLCELDLGALLPPSALRPFQPELQRRATRRQAAADQAATVRMVSDLVEAEAAAAAAAAAAEARLRARPPSIDDFMPLSAALGSPHPYANPDTNSQTRPMPVPARAGSAASSGAASGAPWGSSSLGSILEDVDAQALLLQFSQGAPFSPPGVTGEASGPGLVSAEGGAGTVPPGAGAGAGVGAGSSAHGGALAISPPLVHQGYTLAVSFSSVAKYGYAAGAEAGAWGGSSSREALEGGSGGLEGEAKGGGVGASGGAKGSKDKRKKKGVMLLPSSSHREGV